MVEVKGVFGLHLTCLKSKKSQTGSVKMPVMFLPGLLIQATAVTKRVEEKFLLFLNGFRCLVHSLGPLCPLEVPHLYIPGI